MVALCSGFLRDFCMGNDGKEEWFFTENAGLIIDALLDMLGIGSNIQQSNLDGQLG